MLKVIGSLVTSCMCNSVLKCEVQTMYLLAVCANPRFTFSVPGEPAFFFHVTVLIAARKEQHSNLFLVFDQSILSVVLI